MPAPSSPPPPPRSTLWATLGLSAVVVLLFRDALRGWTLSGGDLQYTFLGQLDAFVRCIFRGSWPVWDPFLGFGQPLLANPGTQVLYPPTWLNLLVLPETYLTLYVAGHALWAGLGLYRLARHGLGLSAWAAWLAGAGWMASGPLVSHAHRWQHFASVAWLPWVILSARRCVAAPSARRVFALAGTLGLQWLCGSVELAAATLLVALGWTAGAALRETGGGVRLAGAWVPALAVAAALTAALWLPALDLVRRSARADVAGGGQMIWAVHPWRWVELVAPLRPDEMPLRAELRARLFGPAASTIVPSLYLGASLGGFVLLALWASPRRRLVSGLAALALGAGLVAMGPHVGAVTWLGSHVPGLSLLRYPGKLALLVSFAWALLAALGADCWRGRLAQDARRSRVLALGLGVATLPALGLTIVSTGFPELLTRSILLPPPPGARVWDAVWLDVLLCGAAIAAAGLVAVLAWLATRRRSWRPLCLGGVAVVAILDPILPNQRVNVMAPVALVGQLPETAQRLRQLEARRIHVLEYDAALGARREPERGPRWEVDPASPLEPAASVALGMNLALAGRSASRWGLPGSYAIEAVVVPTEHQRGLAELLGAVTGQPAMVRVLQAGGVSHVLARESVLDGLEPRDTIPSPLLAPIRVFAVPDPLPPTFAVGRALRGSDAEAIRLLLDPSFDLRRGVVLADGPALESGPGFSGASRITRLRPDRVEVAAELSEPGYVVLLDLYDPGWRATVDERPVPIRRANYGFRAVAVPAGRHTVRMLYRPPAVTAGALVSALSLAAVGLGVWWSRERPA